MILFDKNQTKLDISTFHESQPNYCFKLQQKLDKKGLPIVVECIDQDIFNQDSIVNPYETLIGRFCGFCMQDLD